MAKYKQKIAEYYNRRVKLKKFSIGDLVLRKVTPATKDPAQASSVQIGRESTESSTTHAREATI